MVLETVYYLRIKTVLYLCTFLRSFLSIHYCPVTSYWEIWTNKHVQLWGQELKHLIQPNNLKKSLSMHTTIKSIIQYAICTYTCQPITSFIISYCVSCIKSIFYILLAYSFMDKHCGYWIWKGNSLGSFLSLDWNSLCH